MKIAIIGAGNVGAVAAIQIAKEQIGDIVMVDIAKGLASAKALDMEDTQALVKADYAIQGSEEINKIQNSDIIVVTAGLTRKPGMAREELLGKNAAILKDVCLNIKTLAPKAIVIIVTNPLDLMTTLALKILGFSRNRVFGMGITLDAARFSNLISEELNIPVSKIEACVIGSHGQEMLPLPRFSYVKGEPLNKILSEEKIQELVEKTINRGAEIVSLFGNGSAYFAPAAAIAQLVIAIARNQKCTLGVSAYLDGEYGVKDICLGVPCILSKEGIQKIIELELNPQEKENFLKAANNLKEQYKTIS